MDIHDLPVRWRNKIVAWLQERGIADRTELKEHDFEKGQVATLTLADGSSARFVDPLVIKAFEYQEVGIFTRAGGFHVFTLKGTTVEVGKGWKPPLPQGGGGG